MGLPQGSTPTERQPTRYDLDIPGYLDGSAGQGAFGSAATIFKPDGEVLVLCSRSPYHSSKGADYWAVFMLLLWPTSLHSPMQCVTLGDDDQVIRTTDAQHHTMASGS